MDKVSYESSDLANDAKIVDPLPSDFENYIPWACLKLGMEFETVIAKTHKHVLLKDRIVERIVETKLKPKLKQNSDNTSQDVKAELPLDNDLTGHIECIAKLTITCDSMDNLFHIKFDRYSQKPQPLFKLISLIVPFHTNLTSITVEPPIERYVPYEVSRILRVSNIIEVNFDGCFLLEGSFHWLLEGECRLKKLTLARCGITDEVLAMLCSNLVYPSSASKSLSILNLASNKITDVGANHIADVLRSNRKLVYLNISDNSITDVGAGKIFDALYKFPLNDEELIDFRTRYLKYQSFKVQIMKDFMVECKKKDLEKQLQKKLKKRSKLVTKSRSSSLKGTSGSSSPVISLEENTLMNKANKTAEAVLGEFVHPFTDITVTDGVSYSLGNNTLQMLNLAFNHLTYLSLKKLVTVLLYQNILNRRPVGITYVCLNGNKLPRKCVEYAQVEEILNTARYNSL